MLAYILYSVNLIYSVWSRYSVLPLFYRFYNLLVTITQFSRKEEEITRGELNMKNRTRDLKTKFSLKISPLCGFTLANMFWESPKKMAAIFVIVSATLPENTNHYTQSTLHNSVTRSFRYSSHFAIIWKTGESRQNGGCVKILSLQNVFLLTIFCV